MTTQSNSVSNNEADGVLENARSQADVAANEIADVLSAAMAKTRTSNGAAEELIVAAELAEIGALPPPDNEGEEEVEVMSDEPEFDTSRADAPPPRFGRLIISIRRAVVNVCVLMVLILLIVGVVHVSLRMSGSSEACVLDATSDLLHTNMSFVGGVLGLSGCTDGENGVKGAPNDTAVSLT